jgi:hypothetical protein
MKPIAIYLPQFHAIPENDAWWGQGFTEWTNVRSATPLFKGHEQPQVPDGFGYYDLNDAEVMRQQAVMAARAGIAGFMFYHYWFHGKELLEMPVRQYVASNIDFPFMLCWANENWTRRWDGDNQEVLMEQTYSAADDVAHMQHLLPVFANPRYIKVAGKPVFVVYRSNYLPNSADTCSRWQQMAREAGFRGLYLIRIDRVDYGTSPQEDGFDAAMNFHPRWPLAEKSFYVHYRHTPLNRLKQWLGLGYPNDLLRAAQNNNFIADYATYVRQCLAVPSPGYLQFPCVMPGWDNSPRRKKGGALLFTGSNPDLYQHWLEKEMERFDPSSKEASFVFINAWNEWAEGCHLEPCQKWGRAYLEATLHALESAHQSAHMP